MRFKLFGLFLAFMLFFSRSDAFTKKQAEESQQQINDFSLAGYGERGRKTWEISGKSADIFTDLVKLKDIVGNMYTQDDNIKLTAERGDFNKASNNVRLEQNVVVTTSSGAKLTTNSLDWDRKSNVISTKDEVNIERDNIISNALGAQAEPGLNKVTLEKNVSVQMLPVQDNKNTKGSKITITCDGQLNIDYAKNVATFNDNVKVDRQGSQIYADIMDIYFISGKESKPKNDAEGLGLGGKIDKIVARGNVKIVRGENVSYSDEAVYSAADKKITLSGRPRLVIESTEDFKNASFGN